MEIAGYEDARSLYIRRGFPGSLFAAKGRDSPPTPNEGRRRRRQESPSLPIFPVLQRCPTSPVGRLARSYCTEYFILRDARRVDGLSAPFLSATTSPPPARTGTPDHDKRAAAPQRQRPKQKSKRVAAHLSLRPRPLLTLAHSPPPQVLSFSLLSLPPSLILRSSSIPFAAQPSSFFSICPPVRPSAFCSSALSPRCTALVQFHGPRITRRVHPLRQ